MGSTTPRLGLYKPAEVGEVIDVKTAINDNLDKLDRQTNTFICTSTTRPPAPFDGMFIKETDTGAIGIWDAGLGKWAIFDTRYQDMPGGFLTYSGVTQIANIFPKVRVMRHGRNARGNIYWKFNSSSNTGQVGCTLPYPPQINLNLGGTGLNTLGFFAASRPGSTNITGEISWPGQSNAIVQFVRVDATNPVGSSAGTGNGLWNTGAVSGDEWRLRFDYEVDSTVTF